MALHKHRNGLGFKVCSYLMGEKEERKSLPLLIDLEQH